MSIEQIGVTGRMMGHAAHHVALERFVSQESASMALIAREKQSKK